MICASCRYFVPPTSPRIASEGHCRRYPPMVTRFGDRMTGEWPIVGRRDWCGEFADLELPEAPPPPVEAAPEVPQTWWQRWRW